MTSIKVVCTEPGAFHERYGRTVIASFTTDTTPGLSPWIEDGAGRDKGRLRKHPKGSALEALGLDSSSVVLGDIKRPRTTSMAKGKPAAKRSIGSPHVDLRCRGCGLARRVPGSTLWPIFDGFAAAGIERVELRWIIDTLNRQQHD